METVSNTELNELNDNNESVNNDNRENDDNFNETESPSITDRINEHRPPLMDPRAFVYGENFITYSSPDYFPNIFGGEITNIGNPISVVPSMIYSAPQNINFSNAHVRIIPHTIPNNHEIIRENEHFFINTNINPHYINNIREYSGHNDNFNHNVFSIISDQKYLNEHRINEKNDKKTNRESSGSVGSTPKKSRNSTPGEKHNKGLRHFSQKVMEKVKDRGKTTYNEVADELVHEYGLRNESAETANYDNKNIRRRVYDALNVLMAMNIIHKENKEISWVGFPTNTLQECQNLEQKRDNLIKTINDKLLNIKELILQQISIHRLINGNRDTKIDDFKIELPFAAITTPNYNNVDCCVNDSRDQYAFSFEAPFEVFDEAALIKTMADCNDIDKLINEGDLLKFKEILPPTIHPYIQMMCNLKGNSFQDYILANRNKIMKQLYAETPYQQDINDDSIYISKLLDHLNSQNVAELSKMSELNETADDFISDCL